MSDTAVFIDTAGRYQSEGPDGIEWKALLENIGNYRKNRPLDGVVIVVSITQILALKEDGLDLLAGILRERLNDALALRGGKARFPVYLVFTHIDDILQEGSQKRGFAGFTDFVKTLGPEERGQVWGITFKVDPKEHDGIRNEKILARLEVEFDELFRSLEENLLARLTLTTVTAVGAKPSIRELAKEQLNIFRFSDCFRGRENISGGERERRRNLIYFTSALFRHTEYSDSPLLRGIYFTCSRSVAEGIFTERLFNKVLAGDRDLAALLQASEQKPERLRNLIISLAAALLLLLTIGLFVSFKNNQELINRAQQAGMIVKNLSASGKVGEELMAGDLQKVDELRAMLDELNKYDRGNRPLSLRFGLYSGDSISPYLRTTYFEFVNYYLLKPTIAAMAALLQADPKSIAGHPSCQQGSDPLDCYYDLLKAYVMLSQPEKTDRALLGNQLVAYWKPPAALEGASNLLEKARDQLMFYATQADQPDAPHIYLPPDDPLVGKARRFLIDNYEAERKVSRLIFLEVEPTLEVREIRLQPILKGRGANWQTTYSVPGIYTPKGYQQYKSRIKSAIDGSIQEDWVLGPEARTGQTQRTPTPEQVEDFYLRQYSAQWQNFLKGINLPTVSKPVAATMLKTLADSNDSPIKLLMEEVARQTDFSPASGISGWIPRLTGRAGFARKDNQVESDFNPLHDLVSRDKGPSRLSQYLVKLDELRKTVETALLDPAKEKELEKEITRIEGETSDVIGKFDGAAGKEVERVLRQPFSRVREMLLGTDLARLNAAWEGDIFPVSNKFARAFQGGFPFEGQGDVSVNELSRLLNPVDGRLTIFEKEVRKHIDSDRARFADDFVGFLANAVQLRKALFPKGGQRPEISYQLQVRNHPLPGTEISIEIDTNQPFLPGRQPSANNVWPGGTGNSGAIVKVTPGNRGISVVATTPQTGDLPVNAQTVNATGQSLVKPGEWGLFQLIRAGGGNINNLFWQVGGVTITASLRPLDDSNPFQRSLFTSWRPPERMLR